MGIASTLLFIRLVYSQIRLFKVRSVKRVWRINALLDRAVFRGTRAGGAKRSLLKVALDLSGAGQAMIMQREIGGGGTTHPISYLTRREGPTTLKQTRDNGGPDCALSLKHDIQRASVPQISPLFQRPFSCAAGCCFM